MRGLRDFIVTTIITVVAIALTIAVAYWTVGLMGVQRTLVVNIVPNIYAPTANVGVLNEEGSFQIVASNTGNYSEVLSILVSAGSTEVDNESLIVEPKTSANLTLGEKLIYPGSWTIRVVDSKGSIINGYSFEVLTNKSDADIKLSQANDIGFYKTLAITTLVISILGLLRPEIGKAYRKLKHRKNR